MRAKPQPATPSLWPSKDTSPETPLAILGDESGARYSLHSLMECGAEFTYAQLVPFAQRFDPWAERKVIEMKRLKVA
jgi:hypothetical protein